MTVRTEIGEIALAAIRQELPGLRANLQRQLSNRIASRITDTIGRQRETEATALHNLARRERAVAKRETQVAARIASTIKHLQEMHDGTEI